MKVVYPAFEILRPAPFNRESCLELYRQIEQAARTCYRSEDRITEDSAVRMVKMLIEHGHEAMLEHADISVRFTVDRGITHELVRHRLCSFAQESTRYCNYSKDKFGDNITYVTLNDQLDGYDLTDSQQIRIQNIWEAGCKRSEYYYYEMLKAGAPPEIARSMLNHSTASSIVIKTNLREWRHIFMERAVGAHGKPHPEIQKVMVDLLECFSEFMPEVFARQVVIV